MSLGDFHVLGGASKIYMPDTLSSYANSAETASEFELETDLCYPMGEDGDGVIRRLYIPVQWEAGLSIEVTPIVDGVRLSDFKKAFIRTGAGRETFMVDFARRGSSVQALITGTAPTGFFSIENKIGVFYVPALRSARKESSTT
jgi:hypothetical protein